MDLHPAGLSDRLSDTISYIEIYDIVKDVIEGKPHNLLESVAKLIASTTLTTYPQISAVCVTVEKLHVCVQDPFDHLGVEILRFRSIHLPKSDASRRGLPEMQSQEAWSCPPIGVIKLNSDVAIKANGCFVSVVARDHEGQVLKCQVFKESIIILEVAETYAIYKAICLALQERWCNIVCESDNNLAVQSLKNAGNPSIHWSADHFVNSILSLGSLFNSVDFAWVPRSCNRQAHSICKWAANNCFT